MMDCLVFNHNSLPFDHPTIAEAAVPGFLKTCIAAKNAGMKTILVDASVDSFWFRLELASGYFWQNWYDHHRNGDNIDAIRAFRSITTHSPLFNSEDITNGCELYEVSFNGCSQYSAIRAAAWHESPIIGFETRSPWNSSPLQVNILQLHPESSEIDEEVYEILNFYDYSVFLNCLPKMMQKRDLALTSGKKILQHFEMLYPGVFLCGKAMQQLNYWSGSLTILEQVKLSFLSLSQFTVMWQNGAFSHYSAELLRESGLAFQVSGESETVRNNPALRREREFWLPCGRKVFFEQHIKMSYGYRLHFYPDHEKRQIYIGYVGPHLKLR